jgi:hypothetical protein
MSSGHLLISRRSERAQRGAIDCNVLNLAAKLHYRFITYDPLFGQLEVPISIRHVVMLAGPVFSGFWPSAVNFQPVSE